MQLIETEPSPLGNPHPVTRPQANWGLLLALAINTALWIVFARLAGL